MSKDRNNKKGFTLAEVLITLTIIGVVAALTIPSLLANVSDKTYEAKRKGFETRLAQAISQMDALNSYEAKRPSGYTGSLNAEEYSIEYSAMNFITEGLSKVYKITNVCEFEKFSACDFPSQMGKFWTNGYFYTKDYPYTDNINGGGMTADNLGGLATKGAVVRTKNGESILLYYNPRCIAEQDVPDGGSKIWTKEACLFGYFDLDGAKKGPNTLGKDINLFLVLYPDTPFMVTLNPNNYATSTALTYDEAEPFCRTVAAHGYPKGSLTLPSREMLYTVLVFYDTLGAWASDVEGSSDDDYGWIVENAIVYKMPRSAKCKQIRCFYEPVNQ